MIFLGNYKHWIDPQLINYLLTTDGVKRPNVGKNPDVDEFKKAAEVGYDLTKTWWHIYEKGTIPFNITCPFNNEKQMLWWFIKLLPGGMMPMHRDPHVKFSDIINPKRYWMPLQDYDPGHVFIYKDKMIDGYKAGDLWVYEDENEVHGACNISYNPRLTFLFTLHDKV